MFSDHDETSPSIAAVSALNLAAPSVACSMLAVQLQKRLYSQFVDVSASGRGCHTMRSMMWTDPEYGSRYWGALQCRHLCMMTPSLYVTRSATANQCKPLCKIWVRPDWSHTTMQHDSSNNESGQERKSGLQWVHVSCRREIQFQQTD